MRDPSPASTGGGRLRWRQAPLLERRERILERIVLRMDTLDPNFGLRGLQRLRLRRSG